MTAKMGTKEELKEEKQFTLFYVALSSPLTYFTL